jgi:lambda family phage portal protein
VLTYFKDLADYLEAEVVAARVAACLSVFITKADPWAAMEGATVSRDPNTNSRIEGIEPGMVRYLNLGESINALDPKRSGETFQSFIEGVLRLIGAALGMPYELLVKDFSKTNYSSARAALLEGRRMFLHWREWLAAKFCQPIWELVLEEAYLRGLFAAPNFYDFRSEYSSCLWIGGAWGWVDPVKEVEASKKAIDYGLSTHAEEAAAQGRDWEETFEQLQRENQKAGELGLEFPVSGGKPVMPEAAETGGPGNA